jgi:hypothetical protein
VACSDWTGVGDKPEWRSRKERYLAHLADQPHDVLRVLADKLHNARAIVADLRAAGDGVWDRFTGDPRLINWPLRLVLHVIKAVAQALRR